jgi:very-short-patch-repair endonuclease
MAAARTNHQLTIPELFLLLLACLALFTPVPKKGKKPKARRRPLPKRGPFRPKDNPFKVYRKPNQEMVASAYRRRAEHLASPTACEMAFNDILKSLGYIEDHDYERESICFYPGSYVLFDFYFKKQRIAWEVDGSTHDDRGQKNHDEGRDAYFAQRGVKTVRLKNRVVMSRPDVCRELVLASLGAS